MESVSKFFKEEKDPFYQRGVRKGREEGVEQGFEKGVEYGKQQTSSEIVRNLITQLGLSDEQAAGVAGVTVEYVSNIRSSLVK